MYKIVGILCVSLTVVACTPVYTANNSQGYYQQDSSIYGQPQRSALQIRQQPIQAQAPVYIQPEPSETTNKVNTLIERVRRVERAMLRLDRRMQLIERNELSRMSNGVMGGESSDNNGMVPQQGGFQPMSYKSNQQQKQLQRLPVVKRPYATQTPASNRAGYRPVSYQDDQVTSSLGVARKTMQTSNAQKSPFSGMPSIADKPSGSNDAESGSVSIWTINYESGKVWPGREQLTSSRDVINALSGKKPAAIYARGVKPSSKEFRERVRAVSKYLSKVTNAKNVPIASMPAKHMAQNTIEIIVTK